MAKRKRRLPHGQLGEPITLEIEDWREIAKISKFDLKPSVLVRVILATMALAIHGQAESSAPSKAVFAKISKLNKIITALRSDFPSGSDQDSELFFAKFSEIQEYVTSSREQVQQTELIFLLEFFSHMLWLNQRLIGMLLKYATRPDPLLVEGNVWDLWIISLTTIFKNAGLPTEVRKDQESPSRFVIFVREVQERLPGHLYKKRSYDALAKAITRAREGLSSSRTGAASDFLLLNLLGAFKPIASGRRHKFQIVPSILRDIAQLLDDADKLDN
jgi:hypothetical protein